jgi:hypothetical protein
MELNILTSHNPKRVKRKEKRKMLSESLQMRARLASTTPCIGPVSRDTLRSCGFYSEQPVTCSPLGKTCMETPLSIKPLPVVTMKS